MDVRTDLAALRQAGLPHWRAPLAETLARAWSVQGHGDMAQWQAIVRDLPEAVPSRWRWDGDVVTLGAPEDLSDTERTRLRDALLALHPWRKGPFCLFGILIDAEWRSNLKWARLAPHIQPLAGRRVLDVGAGNGYYLWRMAGAGAAHALGIDPTLRFVVQFHALRRYVADAPLHLLPLALEDLPPGGAFDTVFSMGVLYHRRSPLDHLLALRGQLRPGGELVLETLVTEGPAGHAFVPPGRYARMRNVWFLPSPATLCTWLARCGFTDARLVDLTPTTPNEQRRTPWMRFQSLADFLDPHDPRRTVEGHPAPVRGLFLARRAG